jgi:hypothetical protein
VGDFVGICSDDLWARHLDRPADEREIARHFTLSRDDLLAIASKRTDATRLGYALLLIYLRCPGRALEAGEVPPTTGMCRKPDTPRRWHA